MTTFPRSPKLRKGALVAIEPNDPKHQVIAFQYNPETLQRSFEARTAGEAELEALKLIAPPVETLQIEALIDAADQLEAGDESAERLGIHPELAILELLLYPDSERVIANSQLLAIGTLEVLPPQGPLVLFIWGPQRIVPVRVTELAIREEAFDPQLNPIRAMVSLGLRVLTYHDLPRDHPGYSLFLAHQVTKEAIATVARSNDLGSVLGAKQRLL